MGKVECARLDSEEAQPYDDRFGAEEEGNQGDVHCECCNLTVCALWEVGRWDQLVSGGEQCGGADIIEPASIRAVLLALLVGICRNLLTPGSGEFALTSICFRNN